MEVIIYTKPDCPYCAAAKESYNQRGIPFIEFDAQNDREARRRMLEISNGDPTVPVIVENGKLKEIGWGGRG